MNHSCYSWASKSLTVRFTLVQFRKIPFERFPLRNALRIHIVRFVKFYNFFGFTDATDKVNSVSLCHFCRSSMPSFAKLSKASIESLSLSLWIPPKMCAKLYSRFQLISNHASKTFWTSYICEPIGQSEWPHERRSRNRPILTVLQNYISVDQNRIGFGVNYVRSLSWSNCASAA